MNAGKSTLPSLLMGMIDEHIPVLLTEAIDALEVRSGDVYIDATLGAGGHAAEIIKRGGVVIGLDVDTEAIAIAKDVLAQVGEEGKQWYIRHSSYVDMNLVAEELGFRSVSGVLLDLGVSSMQLDRPHRGFSYRYADAPLDSRFDQTSGVLASDVVNSVSPEVLYEIIAALGEEKRARAIADALVRARKVKRIVSIQDVRDVVDAVVGSEQEAMKTMGRVLQSFRMYINDEKHVLRSGLESARQVLRTGGTLVVISFHSLEDRIVKQEMRRPEWRQKERRLITPSPAETQSNRRSKSAKMRVATKL